MDKPRQITVAFSGGCEPVAYDRVLDPKELTDPGNWEYIHMIEHVAYDQLKAERDGLRRALKFYADKGNWERIEGHTKWASNLKVDDCALLNCGGGRARLALQKSEAKDEV